MSRVRVPVSAAAVSLVLATAAACGGGSQGADAKGPDEGPALSGAPTGPGLSNSSSREPGGPSAASPVRVLTHTQLREALIPENAMPNGWPVRIDDEAPGNDTESPEAGRDADCVRLGELLKPERASVPAKAGVRMTAYAPAGRGATAITGVTLASFAPGDAERLLRAAGAALPGCPAETYTEKGKTVQATARAVTAPRLGDEAFAYAVITRVDGQAFVHAVVAVRVGTTIVQAAHVNLTGTTVTLPDENVLRDQVARVQAVTDGRPVPAIGNPSR